MSTAKYIAEIDGLRAIAVLLVLIFHTDPSALSGGYIGVDIFFVISGYLITRIIIDEHNRTNSFSFQNFYTRRIQRLAPALIFTLTISFIFSFLLFTPQHFQRFGEEIIYATLSLSNIFFWSENGYFNTASEFKPLLHTWSLSVEEKFYLFWPAVLVFILKKHSKHIVTLILLTGGLISLGANLIFSDIQNSALKELIPATETLFADGASTIFYLTPFRVFEFAIGALLVRPQNKQGLPNLYLELALTTGLGLIAYAALSFTEITNFPSYNALIPCTGAAMVIYAANAKYTGSLLRNKVMIKIGLISYSVYLIHWPMIVFYKYYSITPLSALEKPTIVAMSLALGTLMHKYIELPFRKNSTEVKPHPQIFGRACILFVIALIIPAASVWTSGGWEWRVSDAPNEITEQLKNSKQFHIDQYGGAGYPYTGWISGGETGIADLVIIGDSHARHYATGLDVEIGKPYAKSIYISSTSCLVLPGVTRTTPGTNWDNLCPATLASALHVIDNSPDAVVIIGESWQGQLKYAATLPTKKPIEGGNSAIGYRSITTKLDELKERIGNRHLIIIGDVPGAGTPDVIGCFNRPRFVHINCREKLGTLENTLPTHAGHRTFQEYAATRAGVTYINPNDAFCLDNLCRSHANNGVLYSDHSHLSKNGSIVFMAHFKELILKSMPSM